MTTPRSLRIERPLPHCAEIVLLGPGRGNAMGPDFWRELPQVVAELEDDAELRVLLLRGDGGQFSYGLDLPAMAAEIGPILADGAPGRARIVALAESMHRGFQAIADSRLPAIVAIEGWCIGAGIELAAACDLRLASAGARFALREVKVGIVPDLGGIQRLPYLVGEGWARRLALTGEEIDADQAQRIGLVSELLEDGDSLRSKALELAAAIAANPPLVVAGIKQTMNLRLRAEVLRGNHEAAIRNALSMQSEDFAEAMRAFMERREAVFRGR